MTFDTNHVVIYLRSDWVANVREAIGEHGSNDDEHDLLVEILDLVAEATGESEEA